METIRVLTADDHTLFRDGFKALLISVPDVESVGETATSQATIELAMTLQPDDMLMDIQMPGINGIEATRHILRDSPHISVIVLTMFEDDESVFAAMHAETRSYVQKDADQSVLLRAIRSVANDDSLLIPEIARRMMHFFCSLPPQTPAQVFPEPTERKCEIPAMIANGDTNAGITEQLVISLKTVRNHVADIFNKFQVADRTQAALRAREAGLGVNQDK